MRKVGDKYYFVYSSWQNHELCYAVSDYPDHGFTFGGTIVSNGDVGYKGRSFENKLNMTGTTHGSIECIDGQWYVSITGSHISRTTADRPVPRRSI